MDILEKNIKSMDRLDLLIYLDRILNPVLDDDLYQSIVEFFHSCKTSVLREFVNYYKIYQNFHEVT